MLSRSCGEFSYCNVDKAKRFVWQDRLDTDLPKTDWANRFLDWPRDNETFALSFTPKGQRKGRFA